MNTTVDNIFDTCIYLVKAYYYTITIQYLYIVLFLRIFLRQFLSTKVYVNKLGFNETMELKCRVLSH